MKEQEWIAERTIWAVDKNGRGFNIDLQIGKPYQTDSKYGDWACPVSMVGLHGAFPDMWGVDSWQALTIATQLIRRLLAGFVEDGGKLFEDENGAVLAVEDLFGEQQAETPEPDGPLTEEQRERVNRLTAKQLQIIDDALMVAASTQWRKVARIVGTAMVANTGKIKNIPEIFYASRVRKLVEEGRLISEGNLEYMRFSEVKMPD